MLLQAYSVYDRKALVYHTPFFTSTDGAAVRLFSDLANDTNTTVGRHPADYVLYHVGNYSDQNASLEPAAPLRHVIDASALLHIVPKGDLFSGVDSLDAHFADRTANSPTPIKKAS